MKRYTFIRLIVACALMGCFSPACAKKIRTHRGVSARKITRLTKRLHVLLDKDDASEEHRNKLAHILTKMRDELAKDADLNAQRESIEELLAACTLEQQTTPEPVQLAEKEVTTPEPLPEKPQPLAQAVEVQESTTEKTACVSPQEVQSVVNDYSARLAHQQRELEKQAHMIKTLNAQLNREKRRVQRTQQAWHETESKMQIAHNEKVSAQKRAELTNQMMYELDLELTSTRSKLALYQDAEIHIGGLQKQLRKQRTAYAQERSRYRNQLKKLNNTLVETDRKLIAALENKDKAEKALQLAHADIATTKQQLANLNKDSANNQLHTNEQLAQAVRVAQTDAHKAARRAHTLEKELDQARNKLKSTRTSLDATKKKLIVAQEKADRYDKHEVEMLGSQLQQTLAQAPRTQKKVVPAQKITATKPDKTRAVIRECVDSFSNRITKFFDE